MLSKVSAPASTNSQEYTDYYLKKFEIWYRKYLPTDVPFKHFARSVCKGRILDIGCGPGRYLAFFGDNAVGVDHNREFVAYCRKHGFNAMMTTDFLSTCKPAQQFDTLIFSHILEHMTLPEARQLIETYLPYTGANGHIVVVVPQGKCYYNDPTHVTNFTREKINELMELTHLRVISEIHHPFPEALNKILVNDAVFLIKKKQTPTGA